MKLFQITEDAFKQYQKDKDKTENGIDLSLFVNKREEAELENGIGHVYISGVLLSNATPMDKALGNTDYKDIIEDIEDMLEAGASAILLHINSGGGSVMGCVEVAKYISELQVPVVVHVDSGICMSAAYKLAAGASWIMSTPSSEIGNIGTIMVFTDTSRLSQAMGVEYIAFVNDGAVYKSIGHTDSLTEEQAQYLQTQINLAGEEFQDHVLSNRAVSPDVFTAAWYHNQYAVDAGLVDEIGDEELAEQRCLELVAALAEDIAIEEEENFDNPETV
jgi:ClpP class serine protease